MKGITNFIRSLTKVDIFSLFLTIIAVFLIMKSQYYSNTYLDWIGLFITVMSQFVMVYFSIKKTYITKMAK